MQTYSHAIVNAALGKTLEKRGIRPKYWALVIGSLIPDAALTVLTINYINRNGGFGRPPEELFGPAYDAMYFGDPVWITGHSLFHAPFMIAVWLFIGWFFGFRRGKQWGQWIFWFAVGNGLHSFVDILTHHHDGPLLLYPFNWEMRFQSPVSYWDPQHYGLIFAAIEHIVDVLLLIFFGWDWWTRRNADPTQDPTQKEKRVAAQGGG